MMPPDAIEAYARLLTGYCVAIQPGDSVLIRSTTLAGDLMVACQKQALQRGALTCEFDVELPEASWNRFTYSSDEALATPPILRDCATRSFDVMVSIHAPFDTTGAIPPETQAKAQAAMATIREVAMRRGQNNELRWVLCNYPTEKLARLANMTMTAYSAFVQDACFLNKDDAAQAWKVLSARQESYVARLNTGKTLRFVSSTTDITMSIDNRRWINSDGKRNMPSGEVFTSPVETSATGTIQFDQPSLLFQTVVRGLRLDFDKGVVVSWDCETGHDAVSRLLAIPGANVVGEIAIGTNDAITQPTLNTLFDEKMGGTIHLALGASYPETGGRNMSAAHHDFVTSFNQDSRILLDGHPIFVDANWVVA